MANPLPSVPKPLALPGLRLPSLPKPPTFPTRSLPLSGGTTIPLPAVQPFPQLRQQSALGAKTGGTETFVTPSTGLPLQPPLSAPPSWGRLGESGDLTGRSSTPGAAAGAAVTGIAAAGVAAGGIAATRESFASSSSAEPASAEPTSVQFSSQSASSQATSTDSPSATSATASGVVPSDSGATGLDRSDSVSVNAAAPQGLGEPAAIATGSGSSLQSSVSGTPSPAGGEPTSAAANVGGAGSGFAADAAATPPPPPPGSRRGSGAPLGLPFNLEEGVGLAIALAAIGGILFWGFTRDRQPLVAESPAPEPTATVADGTGSGNAARPAAESKLAAQQLQEAQADAVKDETGQLSREVDRQLARSRQSAAREEARSGSVASGIAGAASGIGALPTGQLQESNVATDSAPSAPSDSASPSTQTPSAETRAGTPSPSDSRNPAAPTPSAQTPSTQTPSTQTPSTQTPSAQTPAGIASPSDGRNPTAPNSSAQSPSTQTPSATTSPSDSRNPAAPNPPSSAPSPSAPAQVGVNPNSSAVTPGTTTAPVPSKPLPPSPGAKSPLAAAPVLVDVPASYWAYPFVSALQKKGAIAGVSNGEFEPDRPVTRAELAEFISNAFGEKSGQRQLTFSDIPTNFWANEAIAKAVATGFMSGYAEGDFRPNQPVPRYQVWVSLASGLKLDPPAAPTDLLQRFGDRDRMPEWAVEQVAASTAAGLVVNHPDLARLDPEKPATRAEVAAAIYQALVQSGEAKAIDSRFIARP